MKQRERNIAHLWCDKRIMRFLRHNFDKLDYKRYRNVYLALCEIDSDFSSEKFSDEKSIHNLTQTCCTYTGMDQEGVTESLRKFREIGLIDYGHKKNVEGKVIGSFLILYEFPDEEMLKTLIRKNPVMEKPGSYIKNRTGEDKNSFSEEKEGKELCSKEHNQMAAPLFDTSSNNSLQQQPVVLRRRKLPMVPSYVKQIFDYWESKGLHHLNPDTKSYQESIQAVKKLMRGTFFVNANHQRRYLTTDIIVSINNFALAALNPDYEPLNDYKQKLAKTPMNTFFLNPFAEKDKSLFLKYLEGPPREVSQLIKVREDTLPNYTKAVKDVYIKRVLGGVVPVNGEFSPKVINQFIKAGGMTATWFKKNSRKLNNHFTRTPFDQVNLVLDALQKQYGNDIHPGHLCSDYTFNELLPKYLKDVAILGENIDYASESPLSVFYQPRG